MKSNYFFIFVSGKDKPGIISKVTEILYKSKGNLEDLSMNILEGQFAMVLSVRLATSDEGLVLEKFSEIQKRPWGLKVAVHRCHKQEKKKQGRPNYLVSLLGRDQVGIVYKVSQYLSKQKVNITDLTCRIVGSSKKPLYSMLMEISIPSSVSISKINSGLKRVAQKNKMDLNMRPIEALIF